MRPQRDQEIAEALAARDARRAGERVRIAQKSWVERESYRTAYDAPMPKGQRRPRAA